MVHDLRVCARYARTQHGQLPAVTCGNVAAIFWGSSGRRFKSCQPDQEKAI